VKFKIDENLPVEIADEIRGLGHEADTVFGEQLSGFPDAKILAAAEKGQRVLLTMDKGIANVRLYPPEDFTGIVLFRPKRAGRLGAIEFVRQHLLVLQEMELTGRLIVITEAGMRIR
jgi:predicted nuclease of predicted toxin-antitoxin system